MSDHSTDVLRGLAATQWQCTTQACPDCAAAQQRIAELEQVSGDLCPRCGWAGIRAGEPCAFCQQGQYIDRIAELEAELQHKLRLKQADEAALGQAGERIAELERVFTCQTCGAQFPKGNNPDVLYEGVTQCGKCVEVEALIAANVQSRKRIAELEAHLGDLMMAAALLLNYGDDADVLLPNLAAIIGVAEAAMPDWGPNLDAELAKVRARNRAMRAVVDAARGINTDPCRQHPVFTRCMTHGTDAPRDSVTGKPGNCPHARLRTALAELEPPQHTRTVDELFAKPPITMTAEEAAAMGIPSLDDRRF